MPHEVPPHWGETESGLRQLWIRAQLGDEPARHQALQRIARLIRIYFRRRLSSRQEDIEDLVQDCLLALHLRCSSYDPLQPITAWIFAIARHKLIDYWRRIQRCEALHESLDDVAPLLFTEADLHARHDVDVRKLLSELTPTQRQAIELTKLDGLSVAQAAALTGLSEVALRVQVHRGLKRLNSLMKNTGH